CAFRKSHRPSPFFSAPPSTSIRSTVHSRSFYHARKFRRLLTGHEGHSNFLNEPVRIARSIADIGGGFTKSLLLDKGYKAGISLNDIALIDGGLSGRIVAVNRDSARLLLISDVESRIPVIIEPEKIQAILIGDGTDRPQLRYIEKRFSMSKDARIITTGNGGVFPPGVPVGVPIVNSWPKDSKGVAKEKMIVDDHVNLRVLPFAQADVSAYFKIIKNQQINPPE
ncbi:MAG: rod shape-determining protein MreC, partial [Pseudomonadota bacterium]